MKQEGVMKLPKALAFDVFGTVVDWRGGIAREAAPLLDSLGRADITPEAFADGWRARYQPAMARVRSGERPFVILDALHRETLEDLLVSLEIDPAAVGDERLDDLTLAWHRLDPWPDAVAGLTQLKRRFPIVTLSNGNIALMLDMARRAALPWDAILGAEVSGHYKPDPEAYLASARALAIQPDELSSSQHIIVTSLLRAAAGCSLLMSIARRNMAAALRPTAHSRKSGNGTSAV